MEMVLVGRVNKSIVALIEKCDGKAVGLCGKDAGLVKADIRDFEALGYVGDVTSVDVTILKVGVCGHVVCQTLSLRALSLGLPSTVLSCTLPVV